MARLPFGTSSYERTEGDIPALPVINMYREDTPSEGVVLQSRPSLSDRSADMGSGPVEALFARDGVVSGNLLGVSGGRLYDVTTDEGAIAGSGPFRIAGNEIGAMIATGGTLYYYTGTGTLATVAFPDSADVADVFVGGARYWMVRKDTGKLYFTDALEADVEALDFVTAESLPDRLLQGLWIDDIAILFGQETVEFWPNTTSSTLPIQPLEGRVIEKGLKATGCATTYGSTFAWVTNENQVCLSDENNVISNPGLEARIEASATARLFTFLINGTELLCLRIDNETQVFNRRTGTWSEFQSYGQTNWIPQCFANGVFGSAVDGKTYAWGTDHVDAGGDFERRWPFGFVINDDGVQIDNVRARVNAGQTPFLTGDYADPTIEIRLSRDLGQTFDDWQQASLGVQGAYRDLVEWRALGLASWPGFYGECRVTDRAPVRVSGMRYNEPFGGR